MRTAILLASFFCGARLMAIEPLIPESFLTHLGIYQRTNVGVVTELTIDAQRLRSNSLTQGAD